MLPKRRGRPKKMMRKLQHIAVNKVHKKMRAIVSNRAIVPHGEFKLDGVKGQRRITLANKKEYKSFSIIK